MSSMPPPQNIQPPGPYGQSPYGGFPPPPRKRRKWPWVLGGIVVVFVAIIASCTAMVTSATHQVAQEAKTGIPASAINSAAAPGSEVRDGKFGFTVTQVEPPTKSVGTNEFMRQDAQGEYILVHVGIANTAAEEQTFDGDNQKLIDNQGHVYSDDSMAEANLNQQLLTSINPGNQITEILVYDVPEGTIPAVMEFHDSAFSGGAKVSLG